MNRLSSHLDPTEPLPSSSRQRATAVWFHLGGLVLTAVATAVAFYASIAVAFGTSTCPTISTADHTADLRLGLAVVGGVLALVPLGWAWHASRRGFGSAFWLLLSSLVAFATILVVANAQASEWCF
jgi:hypothetical protein